MWCGGSGSGEASFACLFFVFVCSRESADSAGLLTLLGDYRVACLYSKVWGLREAAVIKTQMLLEADFMHDSNFPSLLRSLVAVVGLGIDDKIQQVLFSSLNLLDIVLSTAMRYVCC